MILAKNRGERLFDLDPYEGKKTHYYICMYLLQISINDLFSVIDAHYHKYCIHG